MRNPESQDEATQRLLIERPTGGNAEAPVLHPVPPPTQVVPELFNFVEAAETRPEFASELPKFVAWIRKHFKPSELVAILKPTRTRGTRAYFGTGIGAVVRDRKRLERIRFLLVDSGTIN